MKNIKARTLWIIVAVLFVIVIGLIFLCPNTDGALNTIIIIGIAISFLAITFLVQAASFKSFKPKQKAQNYIVKEYIYDGNIETLLMKKGYEKRNKTYGKSYLKIDGNYAYKVVLVENIENYFKEDPNDVGEPNPKLDSCEKLIGIEIFLEIDEASIRKIPDFSFQGKNVYYTALVKQDNDRYVCMNYLEPNDDNIKIYEELFQDLELKEIIMEDNKN